MNQDKDQLPEWLKNWRKDWLHKMECQGVDPKLRVAYSIELEWAYTKIQEEHQSQLADSQENLRQATIIHQKEMNSLEDRLAASRKEAEECLAALENAIALIKIYHNCDEVWEIYYKHSPEMKRMREILAKYPQPQKPTT